MKPLTLTLSKDNTFLVATPTEVFSKRRSALKLINRALDTVTDSVCAGNDRASIFSKNRVIDIASIDRIQKGVIGTKRFELCRYGLFRHAIL